MVDQLEKPKVKNQTWVWLIVGVFVAVLAVEFMAENSQQKPPSQMDRAEQALNELWVGYTTAERLDFCAEVRAAGYQVVAAEIARARMMTETREIRHWLEDRCG